MGIGCNDEYKVWASRSESKNGTREMDANTTGQFRVGLPEVPDVSCRSNYNR